MILPEPENTGVGRRLPNMPQGSSGYVAPGGQVLYPGDGSGNAPWAGASGLGQLLQSLQGSGIESLFGGLSDDTGDLGSLGPGSPVSGSQLVDFMNTLFQMPIMNQYGGNFGSRNDDAGAAIANFAATLHQMGDPTHGRVPGTSKNDPNIPTPADFAAHARAVGAQIMKQWTDYGLHGHGPNRGSPISGGPHPQWWTDPDAGTAPTKPAPTGTGGTPPAATGAAAPTATSGGYDPIEDAKSWWKTGWPQDYLNRAASGLIQSTPLGAINPALGLFNFVNFLASGAASFVHPFHLFPSDDGGGGGGGPRSNPATSVYMPDPETGSGGGPRGYSAMPDPETGSGGGPRGYGAMVAAYGGGDFWFPNPDDTGSGGPRT